MPRNPEAPWNDNLDAELRRLWDTGLSARKMGLALGLTKNQVIGRVHRLKFPQRPRANVVRNPPKQIAKIKPVFKPKAPSVRELPAPKPVERIGPPSDRTAGAPTGCQWPMKQKGYYVTFCGKERFNGKPYCEEHTRRAYGPPKPLKGQSL